MSKRVEMVCKPELANLLVETHCASTKKVATTILDRLFGHITLEAFHGKKVRIHGFGTFSVKHKPARQLPRPEGRGLQGGTQAGLTRERER
ncbi:HU family DNA-binding protein, partial [Acidithiobacillus sp. MC6.1]|nr:HU family DNA-binding protein [Acidithiobacillus sp. MC6.1]